MNLVINATKDERLVERNVRGAGLPLQDITSFAGPSGKRLTLRFSRELTEAQRTQVEALVAGLPTETRSLTKIASDNLARESTQARRAEARANLAATKRETMRKQDFYKASGIEKYRLHYS